MRKPSTFADLMGQVTDPFQQVFLGTGGAERLAVVRKATLAIVVVWVSYSLAMLFWSLWPSEPVQALPADIINPATPKPVGASAVNVTLEDMLGLGLFGEPLDTSNVAEMAPAVAQLPDGIEAEARETRLDVVLVGTLAESGSDLGAAVMEVKGQQRLYTVGDELPLNGTVSLAKVLSTRVVLNNNGTYELVKLFDDNAATFTVSQKPNLPRGNVDESGSVSEESPPEFRRVSAQGMQVAKTYREQLYDRPEALADLIEVQAVQDAGGLRGYRVSPGRNAREFKALGFEAGDIVTAVNGLTLADPGNGVRLYSLMRETDEARFTIERNGTELTLAISLTPELQER